MVARALLPLIFCVLLETIEQLSYSLAGYRPHERRAWIAVGVGLHLVLLAGWFWLLTLLPLGVALPLRGAAYLTITFASKLLLKESVTRRCWAGVVAIVLGLALVGTQ